MKPKRLLVKCCLIILLFTMSSCGLRTDVDKETTDFAVCEDSVDVIPTDIMQVETQEENISSWDWSASQVDLDGLELQAVTVYGDKLYFVSNAILYQSELDGSNIEQMEIIEPSKLQFVTFMCIDTNSNLWFAEIGGYVFSYSMEGEKLNELKLADNPDFWALRGGIFGLSKGKVGAVTTSSNGNYNIYAFDTATEVPEIITSLGGSITTGSKPRYAYISEAELLIWDDEGIYRSEVSENYELSEEKEELLKWNDVGIYGESLRVLGMSSEKSIILMSDGILYLLEKISTPVIDARCELELAVVGYLSDELSVVVSDYNLSQDRSIIRIVEYEDIQLLNAEIVAGKVPDLMITDSIPFSEYASKGIFEDLAPYFEENSDISLLPSIEKALSTNNKLYRTTPSFMIMTMIASSDYVDKEMGWTFEEMYHQVKSGMSAFPMDWNRDNALQFLILQNISDYVDWERAESYFDSEDFMKMLEMVKSFPEVNHLNINDVEQVNNGKQLMLQRTLASHFDFTRIDNQLDDKAVFKGFPGESRTVGTFFTWPFTLAMTTQCSNKEEGWNFIQFTLKNEYSQGFSTVDSIYKQQEKNAMTVEYVEQNYNAISDNVSVMTTGQMHRFNDFLMQVTTLVESNQVISEIIIEEVNAYFLGHKTVEDVANIIQNRVGVYLQENTAE